MAVMATLLLLVECMAVAQNGFNMPYSQFGIGLGEMPYNMPMAARMGGAVYTRSGNNIINPFNPASYGSIGMQSLVFDMGLNIQLSTLQDHQQSVHDADGNIGYLAIGLPLTKWWKLAAGLMPYSSVDYDVVIPSDGITTRYDGTGGANEIFLGTAFDIPAGEGRSLAVGFNVGYLTGSIERAITYTFDSSYAYHLNSRKQRDSKLSNVLFDAGLQFRQALGENYTIGLGLTYKPYQKMSMSETAMIYTFYRTSSGEALLDTVFPARGDSEEIESTLEQPHTLGIGLSLERNGKWQVAADATLGAWNGMKYTEDASHRVFGEETLLSGSFSRYAIGFERIGNMDASTYWGRISWGLGAHAEQGSIYLKVDGAERRIDQWGVGAGMSFPMRKGSSLLTVSVGYNSLGNTDVLQRNTVTFGIAISSCERWFVKRKYN